MMKAMACMALIPLLALVQLWLYTIAKIMIYGLFYEDDDHDSK